MIQSSCIVCHYIKSQQNNLGINTVHNHLSQMKVGFSRQSHKKRKGKNPIPKILPMNTYPQYYSYHIHNNNLHTYTFT